MKQQMSHLIYSNILRRRNLSVPTNPIWKMNISSTEEAELATTLHEAYESGALRYYGKEAALYYAVWWQRTYSGGVPSKEMIAESIGIPISESDTIYKSARQAMHDWGFQAIHDTRYHYFRSLLLQGGLPINHVVKNKGNFNNYTEFLKSLVHDVSNLYTDFTADIVPKLSCVSYLPKSFCNNSIYEISIQIAHAILENREDLLPYDSNKQELKELTSSLRRTAHQAKKEGNRRPLTISWEMHIIGKEAYLNYSLNNIANIGSDMIPGLNPRECFSFDLFVSAQYVATFKRVSLDNDIGHSHGVYHRMNFEQKYFKWKGESYVEVKVIPDEGLSIFLSAINCFPPDFSSPQQFQKINDCYVQQRGRRSEDNIVITNTEWNSEHSIYTPIVISNHINLRCFSFTDAINLENTSTGEIFSFTNTFTKYLADFIGIYIPWVESSNFKLVNHIPTICVYDEKGQKIDNKQIVLSYRKSGETDWLRLGRNKILPFGLIEIMIKFPDDHKCIEKFYFIGDMEFYASKETVDSAVIDFYSNYGKAIIENNDNINTTKNEENRWIIKRIAETSTSPTISFTIIHSGDPALHIEIPAPFKGITLLDSNNKRVEMNDVISAGNLYSYRIISHRVTNPRIRMSYVDEEGLEQRVCINGKVNDGITPLSNFEESIERLYNLYVNDYTAEQNYILLSVNGLNAKVRRYAYALVIDETSNYITAQNTSDKPSETYHGSILAVNEDSNIISDEVEPFALERIDNDTFIFPEKWKDFYGTVFSGKEDENKFIPKKITVHNGNILSTHTEYEESLSSWGNELDNERIDNGKHWRLAIRYFEIAYEYRIPFKAFSCMNEIIKSPTRLTKFIVSIFLVGKQELFISEVNRLEQEYAIGIHWIKPTYWQTAFSSLFSLYQDPSIIDMLLPKLMDFLRDILNSTLDSDYTNTLVSYIMGQDIGTTSKLTSQEMLELRSRSVGKTDGNNDLPRLEITLHNNYYTEKSKKGMTFYQQTMINAPIRIAEYLYGIGPDIWQDQSSENMTLRRVINFYRTYFITVYSEILIKALKYTNHK